MTAAYDMERGEGKERPAPLTPPECDLQDFPFMPLQVARLRDSDLAAEESPEACWYAVLLWAASWHQLPAASLPNNDAVLAKLIGLGRDLKTFRKHKAGALRGFVLCTDGRLYHPVVSEEARNSWTGKLRQRWLTECARIKKANQRNKTEMALPTFEEWMSSGQSEPSPQVVPGDVPRDTADCPPGQPLQGTGTGTERYSSEANASGAASAGSADLNAAAWSSAKAILIDQGGLSPDAAGKFFGKLLSQNGLQAQDLLAPLSEALVLKTQDPQGYLTKAAQARARRRSTDPPKRVGFV